MKHEIGFLAHRVSTEDSKGPNLTAVSLSHTGRTKTDLRQLAEKPTFLLVLQCFRIFAIDGAWR